jgi:hypothetical protein
MRIVHFILGALIAVAVGSWILSRFQLTRNLIFGNPAQSSGLWQP